MAGTDPIAYGPPVGLRIVRAGEETKPPAPSVAREQQLAQELDSQLSERLNQIRVRLSGANAGTKPSTPAPEGVGRRLDILA